MFRLVLISIFLFALIWQAQFSRYVQAQDLEKLKDVAAGGNNVSISISSGNSGAGAANSEITVCSDGGMGSVKTNCLIDPHEKGKLENRYADLIPALEERYGKRDDLHVLELQPRRSTSVARALANSTQIYIGVDGEVVSRAQQLFLDAEGVANAKSIAGDLKKLPIVDGSQDLVVARSSDLNGKAPCSEITRVLKTNGEFVLYDEHSAGQSTVISVDGFKEVKRISLPAASKKHCERELIVFSKGAQGATHTIHGACEFIDVK